MITAHPDDVDYGAAGTVARWTGEGREVHYRVVTSGEAGTAPAPLTPDEVGALRRAEQRAAGRAAGVHDVVFLGHPDGAVQDGPALRRELARHIRETAPHVIVTHSPRRNVRRVAVSHPDHLAVGAATLAAVGHDARAVRAAPAGAGHPAPWRVPEVWLLAGREANHHVDITATIECKVRAVLAHRSQHADPGATANDIRRWAATIAAAGGVPGAAYAESFLVLDGR